VIGGCSHVTTHLQNGAQIARTSGRV